MVTETTSDQGGHMQERGRDHEVDELRRELAALRAEVDELRAERRTVPVDPATTTDEVTDRRALLRRAGVAAAGAVAGGAALALGQASPAAAADGDAIT